jgi:hypothetical protein
VKELDDITGEIIDAAVKMGFCPIADNLSTSASPRLRVNPSFGFSTALQYSAA